MFDRFSLGIEMKFQIVELVMCETRSYVSEILNEGQTLSSEKLKPELGLWKIPKLRRAVERYRYLSLSCLN